MERRRSAWPNRLAGAAVTAALIAVALFAAGIWTNRAVPAPQIRRLEMSLPRLAATEALNLSPDGSQPEIYVSPLLPTGERWQVSASGGQQVQWRADGGELYYLALDNMLMAVPIEDAREFRAGKPASVVRLKSLDIYSSQTGEYDPWRSFEAFEPWR